MTSGQLIFNPNGKGIRIKVAGEHDGGGVALVLVVEFDRPKGGKREINTGPGRKYVVVGDGVEDELTRNLITPVEVGDLSAAEENVGIWVETAQLSGDLETAEHVLLSVDRPLIDRQSSTDLECRSEVEKGMKS